MFKNPFSFEGRIRRTEYGISMIIYMVAITAIQLFIGLEETDSGSLLFLILFIPILWFMIAQGAKRCHDRGNSGWFQLIPFYGLWMLFADSDLGNNSFGPNPKGLGNYDEIDQIGTDMAH